MAGRRAAPVRVPVHRMAAARAVGAKRYDCPRGRSARLRACRARHLAQRRVDAVRPRQAAWARPTDVGACPIVDHHLERSCPSPTTATVQRTSQAGKPAAPHAPCVGSFMPPDSRFGRRQRHCVNHSTGESMYSFVGRKAVAGPSPSRCERAWLRRVSRASLCILAGPTMAVAAAQSPLPHRWRHPPSRAW